MSFYPELIAVEALEPYRLKTTWSTGEVLEVDVGHILKRIKMLNPLLDEENFKKVRAYGGCAFWFEDGGAFADDNLYAWAVEQSGHPSHEMFHVWKYRNKLSDAEAARILGVSPRMVRWYASGRKKIPWHVWYACAGYETLINDISPKDKNAPDLDAKMIETSKEMFYW